MYPDVMTGRCVESVLRTNSSIVSSLSLVPLVPAPLAGSGLKVWCIDDILAGAVHGVLNFGAVRIDFRVLEYVQIGGIEDVRAFCKKTVLSANTLLWCHVMRYPRSFNLTSLDRTLARIFGTSTSPSPPSLRGTLTAMRPFSRLPPLVLRLGSTSSPSS